MFNRSQKTSELETFDNLVQMWTDADAGRLYKILRFQLHFLAFSVFL